MTPTTAQLIALFDHADVGWVFEKSTMGEEPDSTAIRILREMVLVDHVLINKFGKSPLAPASPLVEAISADPIRLKPLIQAFASPITAEMRAMIYCVLDGAEVRSIQLSYKSKTCADLQIVVEYESGLRAEFHSDDVWDFEVLHHFGTMKLGAMPVIDGYYAFRKAAD